MSARFAIAVDLVGGTYVVATQYQADPAAPPEPVRVQRLDKMLRPMGAVCILGGDWHLIGLAPEGSGRLGVLGAENEQPINIRSFRSTGPLTLRVATLDAENRTLAVATRSSGIAAGAVGSPVAVYDRHSASVLIAWVPLVSGVGAKSVRIDKIDSQGRGSALLFAVAPTSEPVVTANLACNDTRLDCLLLYTNGSPPLPALDARLIDVTGAMRSSEVRIARETRGPIGVGPTADGYEFAFTQGPIIGPTTERVLVKRLFGLKPRFATVLDRETPGQPQFTAGGIPGTGLLVWRAPVAQPTWYQIKGQIIH